jgi:lipopolysaccharide export system permease protein
VVAYQLAPVALIIAVALLVTLLSRNGELTALFALGVRPLRLVAPIAAFAAVLGIGLFWLGELVVVGADARAEEIQVKRFNRWGDWATYHSGSSWLRGKFGRVYHLGPARNGGWEPATVLEIAPPFRLSRRIDARRIEPAGPGRWRFLEAVETRYDLHGPPGGTISERRVDVLTELFPETPADLELRSGRPRQLPWRQLREQLRRREKGGQRAREYEAALAAFGSTLKLQKPRRRMPLAGAVALGMGLSLALWAASVIAHAIAISGAVEPAVATAIPGLLGALIAVLTLRRA